MIPQSNGKMFLAQERGCKETELFRRYSTFNFAEYQQENKSPVGILHAFNEITLAGKHTIEYTFNHLSCMLLLPVVGAVSYTIGNCEAREIEAGQGVWILASAGESVKVTNPYQKELVNYLQMVLHYSSSVSDTFILPFSFNWNDEPASICTLAGSSELPVNCYIGRFSGRAEFTHHLTAEHNAVFAFVLQGAFEVQYRLLHEKDGLLLWNLPKAEIEALSGDAIILLVAMPLISPG